MARSSTKAQQLDTLKKRLIAVAQKTDAKMVVEKLEALTGVRLASDIPPAMYGRVSEMLDYIEASSKPKPAPKQEPAPPTVQEAIRQIFERLEKLERADRVTTELFGKLLTILKQVSERFKRLEANDRNAERFINVLWSRLFK